MVFELAWSYGDSNPRPLACHADPISRSTSGDVERGSSCLHQCSGAVGHSLSQPEHGGSQNWLPASGRQRSHRVLEPHRRADGDRKGFCRRWSDREPKVPCCWPLVLSVGGVLLFIRRASGRTLCLTTRPDRKSVV